MDTRDLQQEMRESAFYHYGPELDVIYPAIGFSEEVGEVLGNVKKAIRDDGFPTMPMSKERRTKIITEIGDVIFYMMILLNDLDATVEDAVNTYRVKRAGREERGTLNGEGDDR